MRQRHAHPSVDLKKRRLHPQPNVSVGGVHRPDNRKVPPAASCRAFEAPLANLKKDHAFLLKGDVFTEEVIDTSVEYEMQHEVNALRPRPHPYEFFLYYEA